MKFHFRIDMPDTGDAPKDFGSSDEEGGGGSGDEYEPTEYDKMVEKEDAKHNKEMSMEVDGEEDDPLLLVGSNPPTPQKAAAVKGKGKSKTTETTGVSKRRGSDLEDV